MSARRTRKGELTQAVFQLHADHPDWTGPQIAEALGCTQAAVRNIARKNGIVLLRAVDPRVFSDTAERQREINARGLLAWQLGVTEKDIRGLAAAKAAPARRSVKAPSIAADPSTEIEAVA